MILKGLLGVLVFIFFFIVLILMLTGGFILRTISKMRKAATDAVNARERQYRDETGRQRQQYSQRQQNAQRQQGGFGGDTASGDEDGGEYYTEAIRTQTSTGETIIDHRHQQRENKKIFDDADGEYVDFVEER